MGPDAGPEVIELPDGWAVTSIVAIAWSDSTYSRRGTPLWYRAELLRTINFAKITVSAEAETIDLAILAAARLAARFSGEGS